MGQWSLANYWSWLNNMGNAETQKFRGIYTPSLEKTKTINNPAYILFFSYFTEIPVPKETVLLMRYR